MRRCGSCTSASQERKDSARRNLRATISSVAGPARAGEIRAWLERALATTAELDYVEAVEWFGLRITPPSQAPRAWLGLAVRTDNQRVMVSEVRRGSPAFVAGVSVGDQVTAIEGEPLEAGQLAARVGRLAPGARVTLSLSTRDTARSVDVTLGTDPGHGWVLSVAPVQTPEQAKRLGEWMRR